MSPSEQVERVAVIKLSKLLRKQKRKKKQQSEYTNKRGIVSLLSPVHTRHVVTLEQLRRTVDKDNIQLCNGGTDAQSSEECRK